MDYFAHGYYEVIDRVEVLTTHRNLHAFSVALKVNLTVGLSSWQRPPRLPPRRSWFGAHTGTGLAPASLVAQQSPIAVFHLPPRRWIQALVMVTSREAPHRSVDALLRVTDAWKKKCCWHVGFMA